MIFATLVALLVGGWKVAPQLHDRWRVHVVERAIFSERLGEAKALLDRLMLEDPRQPHLWFLQAKIARRQGAITEAEEALQRAIELGLPIAEARREFALLGRDRF